MPIRHTAPVFMNVNIQDRSQFADAESRLLASGYLGRWHCSILLTPVGGHRRWALDQIFPL